MKVGTQAGAEWRVLVSAALIGSGVGLGLGAAYMAGGLGEAAVEYNRATRLAEAQSSYSDMLQRDAGQPGVLRLASATGVAAGEPVRDRLAGKRRGGYSSELDCLTTAVYYEARGETVQGQAAVAQVVMNRVKHPAFPKSVCAVVFQGSQRRTGCQFSFACDGSMRARREAKAWARARKIASRTLAGVALADVGSATHFHTTAVAPAWGPQMRRVAQVGLHVFYRFNPRRKPGQIIQATPAETVLASLPAGSGEGPADIRLTSAVIEPAADAGQAAKPAAEATADAAAASPPAGLSKADGVDAKANQGSETSAS
ncbi:cell wall hydrolase [Phenylobacterium sp.]|uniref:cell wall hydrolase n=1 Tax=Phenylobacterium sp. TaxID=1871053 RepID=UPI002F93C620